MKEEVLVEFKKITGQDIASFFKDSVLFFQRDYPAIESFYKGEVKNLTDKKIFTNFDNITKSCESMLTAFQSFSPNLSNVKWWELLELVENIDSRLRTLKKINKWARSSTVSVGYTSQSSFEYTTVQNQTLERVTQDVLKQDAEGWSKIATDNDLNEEKYSLQGGTKLNLLASKNQFNLPIESVVDTITGKSVYGKDIDRSFGFDETEKDLKVLGYDETIFQSVDILINLKKNDNPGFPMDGLQREVIIGGTRSLLNMPIVRRQLSATFSTDDTLKEFIIKSLEVKDDTVLLDFSVSTRLDEVMQLSALV